MNSPQAEGVSPAQISAELSRVLASSEFENSARMKTFLSYLVTETVQGRSERLKGYNIGVDVFERGADFDPQINPIVRVEAGRLRRLLHNYYLGDGGNDPLRIKVPKGAYVPKFEHKPNNDGSKTQKSPDDNADVKTLSMPRGPSVAVLPFDNMSGDPQQTILSDGLSEEIITQLSRFSTLFVVARHTSFQYRNQDVDVRRIGHDLEVHYVLEGSVRTAVSSMRVTAQLIDATSGLHMWADNYDRDLTVSNIIELQDDIAKSVVATIAEPHGIIARYDLARAKRKPAADMDLYTFVLRWFEYIGKYDPRSHADLRADVMRMLEKHPNNSLVWTVRSLLALDEAAFQHNPRADASLPLDRALKYCNKAIDLDPSNAKAFQYLFVIRYLRDELPAAFDAGRRALRLNPNDADLVQEYGMLLCYSGDWDAGLAYVNKAIALNPYHSPIVYVPLCLERYRAGDDEAALEYAEKVEMPGLFWSYFFRVIANAQLQRNEATKTAVAALLEQYPDIAAGVDAELRKWLKEEPLIQRCLEGLQKAGLI